MDLQIITELWWSMIGGLGNVLGTFLAAIHRLGLNAFGILVFPKISLVLVFLVMALVVRPWGLLGHAEAASRAASGLQVVRWRPRLGRASGLLSSGLRRRRCSPLPLVAGHYLLAVASGSDFHAVCGELAIARRRRGPSFGHAAYSAWTLMVQRWRCSNSICRCSAAGGRTIVGRAWSIGLRLVLCTSVGGLFREC